MEKVKLTRVTFSQTEANKLDKKQKKRFIMFTLIMRDLNLLQKCFAYTSNEKTKNPPLSSANTTISLFFLKTLISKIHEMWTFLNENKVLDDYPKFSNDLKSKLDDIINFFSEEKNEEIFSFIRNKFGFHYEYLDDVDELIDTALSNLEHYEAWLSLDSANEIFASSNDVIFEVILSEMKKLGFVGDKKQLMSTLYSLTLKSARLFQEFSTFYITEAFSVKWEQHEEIEIDVPAISEIRLPLIVAR